MNLSKFTYLLLVLCLITKFGFSQDEIIFKTEGNQFSPLIQLNGEATVLWTFADGTTSSELNPSKSFDSEASRLNKLKVTPWNAIQMINIGFDGGDGGLWWLPHVPNQFVSQITNLNLASESLQYWCSSYNLLDTLLLDNFVNLEVVECFLSYSVTHVSLKNTPKLKRLCLEDNNLSSFDISESPALEDIRGAMNNYSAINFSNSTEEFWHICVRDNPQVTNDSQFVHLERFPNIAELFIWNMNQGGVFRLAHNHPTSNILIWASTNHFTELDLRGSLQNENGYAEIAFEGNDIEKIDITGCKQIKRLTLWDNDMTADQVDDVLRQVDALATSNGFLNLARNAIPSAAGMAYKSNLENRGWEVVIAGPTIHIYGNKNLISCRDTTPSLDDNTDFGSIAVGENITNEFLIQNQADYVLNLTGSTQIQLSGTHAGDFSVSTLPKSAIDPWWSTATFQITFSPLAPGQREATILIENDGVDNKNPYMFTVKGTGITTNQNAVENFIDEVDDIQIYPNPNQGIFTLSSRNSDQNLNFTLFNATGSTVYQLNTNDKKIANIVLPEIEKGIYFLEMKKEKKNFRKKIVIY